MKVTNGRVGEERFGETESNRNSDVRDGAKERKFERKMNIRKWKI